MDGIVTNLQYLGEDENPNILLLLGFCRLHHVSHLEFECLDYQDVISWFLTQIMEFSTNEATSDILNDGLVYLGELEVLNDVLMEEIE